MGFLLLMVMFAGVYGFWILVCLIQVGVHVAILEFLLLQHYALLIGHISVLDIHISVNIRDFNKFLVKTAYVKDWIIYNMGNLYLLVIDEYHDIYIYDKIQGVLQKNCFIHTVWFHARWDSNDG